MADIKNIDVFQTVTSVSFEVEPNTDIININKVTTTGYSGVPSLQDVTDEGATTTNPITANSFIKSGGTGANVLLDNGSTTPLTSFVGTTNLTYTSGISNGVVNSNTGTDATIPLADSTNAGLFSATEKTKLSGIASGAEVNVNADWNAVSGDAEILNKPTIPSITGLATTTYVDNKDNSQQLQLNYLDRDNSIFDAFYLRTIADGGTVEASNQLLSSLAVLRNISYVNQGYTQQINADKFVKLGGASDEYLMADGSVSFGGGGGGATNLTTTQTISNFTINSNTGTDATVPLGNGTLAGATLNDYTTTEKNKLAGIATGAEVNVNADWNATSGDAMILNKPSTLGLQNYIASGTDTYTATIAGVTSYVDGAGYLIRFTNGNTQTCSININGLGARTLYRNNDGQLIGGDIQDLGEMLLVYSSALSAFKCIGTSPNDIIAYVTNAESITITKGQPVYAFGGVGDRMTVKLAYNTLDNTSAQTVGLVMSTSIGAGQKGYIITQGLLDGLSTLSSPFIDGDTVYLGATAGTITRVKPSAPNHLVYLGVVTTASAGAAGRMYVKPQNGYELNELHDVALTNPPTNNDGLFYETSTDLWKNKSISTILGYTPGTVSSVAALTLGTSGTNLNSTVATGTTTPVITLNVPDASTTARGVVTTGDQTFAGTKTFSAIRFGATGSPVFFEYFGTPFFTSGTGATLNIGGGPGLNQNNLAVLNGTLKIELQTASTIASFDASKNVVSLPTATYPSLTELTYVKGVTSAIQTQLNAKQPLSTVLTNTTASFTIADETKLDGIAAGATANSSDATLLARANHTGTQLSNTISDFNSATRAQVEAELVAGTNITITPSGTGATRQLTIASTGGGASSQGAFTVLANNTASTAVPTEQVFKNIAEQVYTFTPVWTATTAPSGTTNHTYQWSQIGNTVTVRLNLIYTTVGTGATIVVCPFPTDLPIPLSPSGLTSATANLYYGTGLMTNTNSSQPTTLPTFTNIRRNAANTGYELTMSRGSNAPAFVYITIQYFTT